MSVYQLQETRATKALGRLDRRLTVPSEALESSKEILFFCAPIGNRTRVVCGEGKRANHLSYATTVNTTLSLNIFPCQVFHFIFCHELLYCEQAMIKKKHFKVT